MKHSIKIIGLLVLFAAGMAISSRAQTAKPEKPKKHACTESCSKDKHTYAHGEKKHRCDASCAPADAKKAPQKHVCTDACHKAGKCVMAHGEKGHTCNADCKPKK